MPARRSAMRFVEEKWSKLHEESCAPGEREATARVIPRV